MKKLSLLLIVLLLVSCGNQSDKGADSTIEYSGFSNTAVTEQQAEEMIEFLYEAETKMKEPLQNTTINEYGVEVFSEEFVSKNDLFEYYQQYLTTELSDTMARKVSDLSKSRDQEFLAASDYDWYSILDADPNTIKIIQHTTIQTIVEMDINDEIGNERLQYVIMKNRDGLNPKIVQKTLWYN